MGIEYVRVIGVPFSYLKSLSKGVQIHNISERVQKVRKSKVSLSKGHDFQKFHPKFGENQPKFGKIEQSLEKIDQNLGKSLSKGPKFIKILSLKG